MIKSYCAESSVKPQSVSHSSFVVMRWFIEGEFRSHISLEMESGLLFGSQFCVRVSGLGFIRKFLSMQKSLGET